MMGYSMGSMMDCGNMMGGMGHYWSSMGHNWGGVAYWCLLIWDKVYIGKIEGYTNK